MIRFLTILERLKVIIPAYPHLWLRYSWSNAFIIFKTTSVIKTRQFNSQLAVRAHRSPVCSSLVSRFIAAHSEHRWYACLWKLITCRSVIKMLKFKPEYSITNTLAKKPPMTFSGHVTDNALDHVIAAEAAMRKQSQYLGCLMRLKWTHQICVKVLVRVNNYGCLNTTQRKI